MRDDVPATSRRDLLRSAAGALSAAVLVSPALQAQAPMRAFDSLQRGAAPSAADPIASLDDFETIARTRMTPMAYEYVAGGAGDEQTLGWNRDAYRHIQLRTRVLVDVSHIDTRLTLFGHTLPFPIILSPTAYHKLAHPEGELATARGAGQAGATMIVSSFATTGIEDVARAATRPLWFQIYAQPDRGFTRALVERAEAAGCQALCLTVDTPVLGARYREARAGFTLPAGMSRVNLEGLAGVSANATHRPAEGQMYSAVLDPALTWKDVEWLRGFAKVPVLLKGVLDAEDARHAVDAGVAGLIVSNHGARNLDTVPATVTALPRVAESVAGRIPILVDGGIRRGTDVLKALALGATAVGIGRPYLFGLAVNGANGVARVVDILRNEFEIAMALTGRTSLAAIDHSVLWS
jgi:4-hydroxymandelate oxidase